jgi:DNA-binding transcriptional ArsR family regulator
METISSGSAAKHLSGDVDLAAVGALLAEPARTRILLALSDGRALPATTLAAEAGVAASTASAHLGKLLDAGMLAVRQQGRHRYYHLAGAEVAELLETLSRFAPAAPVRSLKEGTRAHALRNARLCYDHLGGRAGVALFAALIRQELVAGGDGRHQLELARLDRLSSRGKDSNYSLTQRGHDRLRELGLELPERPAAQTPVGYCIDWTEQAHHMSGAVARTLTSWMLDQAWLERTPRTRALRITEAGTAGLRARLGVELPSAG